MDPKTTEVSVAFLLQLYAPLAGLLAVTFWLGVLSQRQKVSERRQDKTDELLKDQMKDGRDEMVGVALLTQRFEAMGSTLEKLEREMRGMQRSLANIANGSAGTLVKFDQEH